MNFQPKTPTLESLHIGWKKSVLNTNFELLQLLDENWDEFEIEEEPWDDENSFIKRYYFHWQQIWFAEISIIGNRLLLSRLGSINWYRNNWQNIEYDEQEIFEESIENLCEEFNLSSNFDKNMSFLNWIWKFIMYNVIEFAKEKGADSIELEKDVTNDEFYEKILNSFKADGTISDFEEMWKLIDISL